MQQIKSVLNRTGNLFSASLLACVLWFIFESIYRYQNGHAYTILVTYCFLFALFRIAIGRQSLNAQSHSSLPLFETALFFFAIIYFVYAGIHEYKERLISPPILDIGYNTVDAAKIFFLEGRNPYVPNDLFQWGTITKFWGYHYGPFMFIGYAASALWGGEGFKFSAIIFLAAICLIACLVRSRIASECDDTHSGNAFLVLVILMGSFVWWDLAIGINDYLPVLLLLLAVLTLADKMWLGSGIILGVAIATKYVPSVLLTGLLIRKKTPLSFYLGLVLGCSILVPFMLWSPQDFLNNVFIFHSSKPFDDSSIYSVTPLELHWCFPLLQIAACLLFWLRNISRELSIHDLLLDYVRLTLIINILFKETHRNHFWWTVPSIAILLAVNRHNFLKSLKASMLKFIRSDSYS